jgi:signal transduction histidine kinase
MPIRRVASLPYIVLPLLLWAAYRFGLTGATGAIAVVAAIAIIGTVYQHGAFGSGSSHSALLMLQLFIGVISITTLLLGTATEERNSRQQPLRQANRRPEERSRELEQSNRELESFSYSVSHDLRAPLRAIDGFAAALCDDCAGTISEQGNDYLRRIRSAAQRMGKLIDEMLELSRVTRIALHDHPQVGRQTLPG